MKRLFFSMIVLLLFVSQGCEDSKKQNPLEYSRYISGFTQGKIRSGDPIYIHLESNLLKSRDSIQIVAENLLKITPKIAGTTIFNDDNSIVFRPTERFKNGKTYKVSLDLEPLFDTPSNMKRFKFDLSIIDQAFSFREGSLNIKQGDNNLFYYSGTIYNSDFIVPEEVEKLVKATIDDKNMDIEWEHSPFTHNFTIGNIERKKETGTMIVTFNKEVTNINDLHINIPGSENFTVINVKPSHDEIKGIDIVMSDNIDPTQDLRGLIQVESLSSLRFNIEGNIIRLYSDQKDQFKGVLQITLNKGIRSYSGEKLVEDVTIPVGFPSINPEVHFIGRGSITPVEGNALIPFTAVGLKSVRLQVVKVFNQNMNFYLQESNYANSSDYELHRVGRIVLDKKIDLVKNEEHFNPDEWQDYTINLTDHIKLEKGVLYRIALKFQRSYTSLPCAGDISESAATYMEEELSNSYNSFYDGGDYYYGYPPNYSWHERNNPCSDSYYTNDHFPTKNFIVTSLGVTAKSGMDGKYIVAVNDLLSTAAISNAQITFLNYQNQKIDSVRTNHDGIATIRLKDKPFTILAQKGDDKAWLKINSASALSYSNFDVSGEVVQRGIKGFIYGERGVWRPGNDIYLSFMLEDEEEMIPIGHPILADLIDPDGNIVQSLQESRNESGLYCFNFKTDDDAVTGYWRAVVKVGGTSFSKTLRIESVKPNRLSVDIKLPGDILGEGVSQDKISVMTRWLHGAKTVSLKTDTQLRLSKGNTSFPNFKGYIFDDYSRSFNSTTSTIYDGVTDSEGSFNISIGKIKTENATGMLNALLTTRVFENSGEFSIVTSTFKYSPYTEYVGIKLPKTDDGWFSVDTPITVDGAVLSTNGKPIDGREIEVEVYSLDWRWWWDSEYDNIGAYVNRIYRDPTFKKSVRSNSNGKFSLDIKCNEWGRYYVMAYDPVSKHSCGTIFYTSSGRSDISGMATLLTLSTDKSSYSSGDKVKINFPSSQGGVALISIENGKSIKDIFRVPTGDESTSFEFTATSDMCPNIYVNVSLIQPHYNRDNDKPIRLYGVVNINIEDPTLHLTPQITMNEELRPSQDFTVTVSETSGKPMNYTLAIVDEGLLSITSFKTPNPFPIFYAREALGVKTWDFYDDIFGAFGGRLEKAFAIGGDEDLQMSDDRKSNRFTPVVIFRGPFTLKPGEKRSHTLKMPEYIGEVRTMVVAEDRGKYGSASKQVKVNKPLMLNVTMPRLFTPGDIIDIPVTLFATKDNIKDVNVTISTDEKITIEGTATLKSKFSEPGEQVLFFRTKIKDIIGTSTITFTANSGSEEAFFSTNVEIRVPNPRVTKVDARELASGESIVINGSLEGVEPKAVVEITSIPALNLEERIGYLIKYPHGCSEQITSTVYPQLMLSTLMDLSEEEKVTTELNIKSVIDRLRNYQTTDGGFSYWMGSRRSADWVTTYITDFLINAEKMGYLIPVSMKSSAISYLNQAANSWRQSDYYSEIEQSYRLYVLAAAGRSNMAAMNRMKEIAYTNPIARRQLAGAYALMQHKTVARSMVANLPEEAELYRQLGRCYGSTLRDNAIILQSMIDMDMREDAYKMVEKMALRFSSNDWLNTQEIAFGLYAIGNYVKKYLGGSNGIDVVVNSVALSTSKTVMQQPVEVKDGKTSVTVKNNTSGILHLRTISSSIPLSVVTTGEMSGLNIDIRYLKDGQTVSKHLYKQGEDITVEISVRNKGNIGRYEGLALTYIFPSGFEFFNERLTTGVNPFTNTDNVDIRDDRVYLYFALEQNETKRFRFQFNAAYPGEYLLPAINCSAMYDNSITATLPGSKVTIIRE